MVLVTPLAALGLLSTLSSFSSAATVQNPCLQLPADAAQNRQVVKNMFLYSYNAYKSVFRCGATVAEIPMVIAESTRGDMTT